jgi:hypothetical protein
VSWGDPNKDGDGLQPRSSHAACLAFHNEDLWLLDTSFDKPLNLTQNDEATRYWLADIQYIAVFKVIKVKYSPKAIEPLADVFERIYRGEPAKPKPQVVKEDKVARDQVRKEDRKSKSPSALKKRGRKRVRTHLSLGKAKKIMKVDAQTKKMPPQQSLDAAIKKERTAEASKARHESNPYAQPPYVVKPVKVDKTAGELVKSSGGDGKKALISWSKSQEEYPSIIETHEMWKDHIKESFIYTYWKEGMLTINPKLMRKCSAKVVHGHFQALG